ncbi:MAG: hypothetical protein ACYDEQ_11300, partial [Desulfocucumaceae bacterium]
SVVSEFSNYHQYIEDVFNFDELGFSLIENTEEIIGVKEEIISEEMANKAKEVCSLLVSSHLWKDYLSKGIPIGFNGYVAQVDKLWRHETKKDIEKYFHIAHSLKLIFLYKNDGWLFIKEGEKTNNIKPIENN